MADPRRRLVVAPDAPTRLDAAAHWLQGLAPDRPVVVCADTWDACDELVRGTLGENGARFGLVRLTLDRLALRLARARCAGAGRAPLGGLADVAVAARAVHRVAARSGLGRFAPVADRPGFPVALADTLAELRLQAVEPAALARLPEGGPELAALLDAYEAALAEAALADRATWFREALAAVEAGAGGPLVGVPLLLLDVSLVFRRQTQLIAALAVRAPAVLATGITGDRATIARLEEALGVPAHPVEAQQGTTSLASVQRHLFEATAPAAGGLDETVSLAAWPGESRECVEIARAVQTEARRGVPFDRMAVLLRSPDHYAAHLEEAFARAAIPAFFARGARRPHPAGRALLTLLACAAEGLSARRFAEYLSLSQVPDPPATVDPNGTFAALPEDDLLPAAPPVSVPEEDPLLRDPDAAPVIAGTLRAPRHWEQLLVDAAVIGGRERWVSRLDGLGRELERKRLELAREDEARIALVERQLRDLEHLRAFALPLVDRLAALPPRALWGDWLRHLESLVRAAIREPEPVVAVLAELAPMAPVGPVDLEEVRLVLEGRLHELVVPPSRRRHGAVYVAPATAARGLAFDVVFVPGLAERLFPASIIEDPILLDPARRLLGVGLATEPDRVAAERLALRVAVGAARRRLILSYPRLDVERARPRVPSFYALEALRAAEGRLPGVEELVRRAAGRSGSTRLGWPAPRRPEDAVDDAEYDLALLAPLLDVEAATVAGTASYLLHANPHLARALRARARRWLRRWTPADGLVDPDELAARALAPHRLDRRSYSPTALQHFAACPYRFFLQAVHRLEPREEPIAVEAMDPLVRGALFHDVQFEVLTRLRDAGALPLDRERLDEAWRVLDTVLAAEEARTREELAPAIPRVWQDAVEEMRDDLREWLARLAADPEGWIPERFELAFGLPRAERPRADPASRAEPVAILDGVALLRGAIDLVERHAESGKRRVTDHKTGRAWVGRDAVVGGGQVLQPLLYALACEQLLGGTVVAGRLYYCTAQGEWAERVVPLDAAGRAGIAAVLDVVGAALRSGFLPAAPAEARTCERCDYQIVCGPWEWVRTQRKPPERLASLRALRAMP